MIPFSLGGKPYAITCDRYQWILSKRCVVKKTGAEEWRPFAFFARADHMADRLVLLGADGAAGDIVEGIRRVEAALREALPRLPKVE